MKKKVYIIAEAGVNHNGSLELAKKLVDAACDAGADAVKFQSFKADKLVSRTAKQAEYQTKNTGVQESQYDMLKKLELNEEGHVVLRDYCREKGIDFLSTPFDLGSLELLVGKFNLPLVKVSSGDLTNAELLLAIAKTGKPAILSTGMSTLGEIEKALGVLAFGYIFPCCEPSSRAFEEIYFSDRAQEILKQKITLLHCTTEYPAPLSEVNLNVMESLRKAFGFEVGYSDHTAGIAIPIAAVALGATVIEKHFTLDRNMPGPDHKASLEPHELKEMVDSIRQVELSLGSSVKRPSESELKNRVVARKSLIACKDISKGEVFTIENLTIKRPGDGVSPFYYWDLLGKISDQDYKQDEKVKL